LSTPYPCSVPRLRSKAFGSERTKFLLSQVQDYAKYAALGWQYLFDGQAVI
jgi:hypothetical protein